MVAHMRHRLGVSCLFALWLLLGSACAIEVVPDAQGTPRPVLVIPTPARAPSAPTEMPGTATPIPSPTALAVTATPQPTPTALPANCYAVAHYTPGYRYADTVADCAPGHCHAAAPPTALPPTATPLTALPVTATPLPTPTALPPTATPLPTPTALPPTATPLPTPTALPPTATPQLTPTPLPTLMPTPKLVLRRLSEPGCCSGIWWSADGTKVLYVDRPDERSGCHMGD